MRVGIYVGAAGTQTGGMHAFVRAVLAGVDEIQTSHSLQVIHSGFEDLPPLKRVGVQEIGSRRRPLHERVKGRMLRGLGLGGAPDEIGVEFLWFLTPAVIRTRLPYAATVWDLAHRVEPAFPEVRTSGWMWDAREAHYRKLLPRATYVIIGAHAGKEDIVRSYGISPHRVRVLPLVAPPAASASSSATLPSGVRQPYLFYPAQFWPHKNHIGLLLALKEVRQRHVPELKLVLTGSDKGNLEHVKAAVAELGLQDAVVFAGFVSNAELASLYRQAEALVFPSFFGPDNLPPLEAMQLGCPVVAANVPGAEEQLGDAAILVDQRNVASIAEGIALVCNDPRIRESLIARGRARAASWTPRDYAGAIIGVVDEFETERRCWSSASEYVHSR